MRDRWVVVELFRNKKAERLSSHRFRWTAIVSALMYRTARPDSYIDVWRYT